MYITIKKKSPRDTVTFFPLRSLQVCIYIPACTFSILDKWLSRFIWQGKRLRLKFKRLLCPKDSGGLDLPSLKNDYWAAQLRIMMTWISEDTDTMWLGMEQSECPNLPIDSIQFLNHDKKITNVWSKKTLKIWSIVTKKSYDFP